MEWGFVIRVERYPPDTRMQVLSPLVSSTAPKPGIRAVRVEDCALAKPLPVATGIRTSGPFRRGPGFPFDVRQNEDIAFS